MSSSAISGSISGPLFGSSTAFRWIPAELSGAKSTKKSCVGFPPMAWKPMPFSLRPKGV